MQGMKEFLTRFRIDALTGQKAFAQGKYCV